jgi:hypothetical protein
LPLENIMEPTAPEILLLNISAGALNRESSALGRFRPVYAPLGLHCLAASAPERIAVIDGKSRAQLCDALQFYRNMPVKTIVLHYSDGEDGMPQFLALLREMFPAVSIGSHLSEGDAGFDFYVHGTGKTAVLRILRGERLHGKIDTLAEDLRSPLHVPQNHLLETGYDIFPEKWIAGRTIEVFQPWLGLLDQSRKIMAYPGIAWIAEMVGWLQKSSYVAFHFNPSGLEADDLHELRSVMLNLRAPFAVSFWAGAGRMFKPVGNPLRQIWLYYPNPETADESVVQLQAVASCGCQPCLQVDSRCRQVMDHRMFSAAEKMVITDQEDWDIGALKHLTGRFWSCRRRFFRRLFGIKNASELINFMKTAYMILEILFASDKKAGKSR